MNSKDKEKRDRGVAATASGINKLKYSKANIRKDTDKISTYSQIAEKTLLSEKTVNRFFHGEKVDESSARRICKVLDVEYSEIIDSNSNSEPKDSNGHLSTDTKNINIYIERPPIEEKCLKAILQPGALIRIRAPQKMGKTLLLEKILDYSRQQNYQIVKLDLKLADKSTLTDLKTFLQWLCCYVSDILEKPPNLDEYWQDSLGLNTSCTSYFQRYLLANTDTRFVMYSIPDKVESPAYE